MRGLRTIKEREMNMKTKILGLAAAAVIVAHSAAAEEKALPLAEARAQIGAIVEDPVSMTGVMKQLAPEDQAAFLADVNAAVAKMPGSNEERAAKFLNVNKAALKGASKGNLAKLIAEVFATVPLEPLALVSERLAADMLNRGNDTERKYTDDAFRGISEGLLERIVARTAGTDDAPVRNALAIAMLVRASNGSPADLADVLVAKLPEGDEKDLTRKEWLPAALGNPSDYEAMLAYAGAGSEPNAALTMVIAGPQRLDAILADVASSLLDGEGRETTPFSGISVDMDEYAQPPRTRDRSKKWNPTYRRGEGPGPEPIDYPW